MTTDWWFEEEIQGLELLPPILKYTGSKRVQVPEIQRRLPKGIKTYWEPFVGGANVVGNLCFNAEKIVCSDVIDPLIQLYNRIQDEPYSIADTYQKHWSLLQYSTEHFYEVRKEFNNTQDPELFFFLCRTSQNGLIRFNQKGWFNASVAHNPDGRTKGANPDNMRELLVRWHERLQRVDSFGCIDYTHQFLMMKDGDFTYLDSPYPCKNSVYGGGFDEQEFFGWLCYLNEKDVRWMLSYPYPETPELVELSKHQDVIEAKTMNFGNLNRTGKLKEFREIIYMNYDV